MTLHDRSRWPKNILFGPQMQKSINILLFYNFQLHIKARGLWSSFESLFSPDINKDTILNLRNLLDKGELPNIKGTPLHLEIIIQMEGKTILSFYLNSSTINNLASSKYLILKIILTIP